MAKGTKAPSGFAHNHGAKMGKGHSGLMKHKGSKGTVIASPSNTKALGGKKG